MSEYINDNWAKGVSVLNIAKDGMFDFIKSTMKSFEGDLRNKHGSSHFDSFLRNLMVEDILKDSSHFGKIRDPKYGCKIILPCTACTDIVDLLRDYMDDKNIKIKWNCHDGIISPDNYWWILSKIYISRNIKASRGPEDVDAQAVFKLMTSCKLFPVKWIVLTLIDWRNKLMHSHDNMVSTRDLNRIFEDAKTLLEHTDVKTTSSATYAHREIMKLQSKKFIGMCLATERHMMIKEALTVKKRCIEDDIEANQNDGIDVDKLRQLLRQTTSYIAEEEKRIQNGARNLRDDIESLRKRTEEAERNRKREKRRADSAERRADSAERRADSAERRADSLEKKLGEKNTTFLGSVATGAAVCGTYGTVGGPVGAVVGGTVGAVFGGISSLFR